MMSPRYTIRTGAPHQDVQPDSPAWGWSKTLGEARRRAAKLSRSIRSDCRIGIECDGKVLEQSRTGISFTAETRPTNA